MWSKIASSSIDDDISRKTRYTATTLIDNDLIRYRPATSRYNPLHFALRRTRLVGLKLIFYFKSL
jgi:hypothetical protein